MTRQPCEGLSRNRNCTSLRVYVRGTEETSEVWGHLSGQGLGQTMEDEEQIHALHVGSKNTMSVCLCDDG